MARVPTDSQPREPLRVLWLIDSLTLGGAESLVLPFARSINPDELELSVVCLKSIGGNPIEERLRESGVEVVNVEARNLRDLAAFRRLVRLLRHEQVQLLHAHLTYAAIWGTLAARIAGIPAVATLHVAPTGGGWRDRVRERMMMLALRWTHSPGIAVSNAVRNTFLAKYPRAQIKVIHNGIDIEAFGKPTRARQRTLIVTVSVLRPGKGIDVLLRALSSVPDPELMIVGEGPMRAEWASLAQTLGVADRVRWMGYREDVPRILSEADLFVLPSLDDAFPTVLLEAMAAELPIVATNVGGIPEIIDSSEVGVLVPPNDAVALAEAITSLLQDAQHRGVMAAAARRRVSAEFSTRTWSDRLLAFYRSQW